MSTPSATAAVPVTPQELPPVLQAGLSPNGNGSSPNGSPRPESPARPGQARPRSRLRYLLVGGALAVLAAVGVGGYLLSTGPKGPRPDLLLHKVKFEPLNLTVVERGALESAD